MPRVIPAQDPSPRLLPAPTSLKFASLVPVLAGATLLFVFSPASAPVIAQSNPLALPRLSGGEFANLQVGTFSIPFADGAGNDISYGGSAVGVSEDGRFLYVSCHPNRPVRGIAKIEIPAAGGIGRVVAPCQGPTLTDLIKILPGADGGQALLGGVLEQGGRTVVTGFWTYDANDKALASHWSGPSLTQLAGPFKSTVSTGLVKDHMTPIPPEWRGLLGGSALSTAGYTSIIGRASYGASVSAFNPADVTRDGFPMTLLLGCPRLIPGTNTVLDQCQSRYGAPTSDDFNGPELSGGAFIVPGTRTLVAIERESSGPYCYGYTTRDPSLAGTPWPTAANPDPTNVPWCYSLSDPMDEKGPKGYPYRLVAKLYDLAELVDVKQGRKQPWDIRQYATVDLPGSSPGEFITSGAYNPVRGEYYLVRGLGGTGNTATIYVYQVGQGVVSPGTPTPYNFRASVSGSTVAMSWDVPSGSAISTIVIEAGSSPGQADILAGASIGPTGSYVAANVPSGAYYTRVRAVGAAGVSAPSNEAVLVVGAGPGAGITPPGAPRDFYATSDSARTVSMFWHPPASGGSPTGFILEAGSAPGRIDIVSGYPLGLIDRMVVPGVPRGTYYVRVRAVNGVGAGAASNEAVLVVP
jgi:hypothetical protein